MTKRTATLPEPMKSVRTAVRLLMEFTDERPHFSVGELAERTGLTKSHVSKLLAALAESGLLVQDPKTRAFSVGVRAFVLGARFVNYDRLSREAMPLMRELTERTGHSSRLSIMDGDHALYLLGVEGPHFVDSGWHAGTWLPLHSSSAGKVLLAFMDAKRADALLGRGPLRRVTDRTVTDVGALRRILARIRASGFDSQRGETTPGLGAIAAPIFGIDSVIGVLSLAFPAHLVGGEAEAPLVAALHAAARSLSVRMGCPVYPFGGAAREPAMLLAAAAARRG